MSYYIGNMPFGDPDDIRHTGVIGMKWGKHIKAATEWWKNTGVGQFIGNTVNYNKNRSRMETLERNIRNRDRSQPTNRSVYVNQLRQYRDARDRAENSLQARAGRVVDRVLNSNAASAVRSTGEGIRSAYKKGRTALGRAVGNAGDAVRVGVDNARLKLKAIDQKTVDIARDATGRIRARASAAARGAGEALGNARNAAGKALGNARNAAGNAFNSARSAAGQAAKRAGEALGNAKKAAGKAGERLGEIASTTGNNVKRFVNGQQRMIAEKSREFADNARRFGKDVGKRVNKLRGDARVAGIETASKIASGVESAVDAGKKKVQGLFGKKKKEKSVLEKAADVASAPFRAVGHVKGQVKQGISDAARGAVKAVGHVKGQVKQGISDAARGAASAGKNLIDTLTGKKKKKGGAGRKF